MKKINVIAAALAVACLVACKKDKKTDPENEPEPTSAPVTDPTYPNYSNLKVGNYWVYERYSIDQAGNPTALNIIDSCYVEKDTTISGKKYFKYMSARFDFPTAFPTNQNPITPIFYRDSLSYIVTNTGRIEFSSQDFTTIFKDGYIKATPNDTVCYYFFKMGDKDLSITTPAGTFITTSFKETYNMYPTWSVGGQTRYRDTRYAANIGKVTEGFLFFASTPTRWERRLIRYHLN